MLMTRVVCNISEALSSQFIHVSMQSNTLSVASSLLVWVNFFFFLGTHFLLWKY